MSEKNSLSLQFTIGDIQTSEFAIIKESYDGSEEVGLQTSINFGVDIAHHGIGVEMKFQFQQSDSPFLLIAATCVFQIEDEAWSSLVDEAGQTLSLPQGFASHLAVITVGTLRGILHEKTQETAFNDFIIPPINLTNLITEDVVLELDLDS